MRTPAWPLQDPRPRPRRPEVLDQHTTAGPSLDVPGDDVVATEEPGRPVSAAVTRGPEPAGWPR